MRQRSTRATTGASEEARHAEQTSGDSGTEMCQHRGTSRTTLLVIMLVCSIVMNVLQTTPLSYSPLEHGNTTIGMSAFNHTQQRRKLPGLPDRVITVFGLESSGTTFVHQTLGKAMGLERISSEEYGNRDRSVLLQHTSLPTGWLVPSFARRFEPLPILPVGVPVACQMQSGKTQKPNPPECNVFETKLRQIPSRYFINVTSHIQWFRERGVDAQAVVVVRDPGIHFQNTIQKYCPNETAAYEQYATARELSSQAITSIHPVLVSYEMLLTLKSSYLFQIYQELSISSRYVPTFKNGNVKYLPSIPQSVRDKLLRDV
jgi:hypothetical protein